MVSCSRAPLSLDFDFLDHRRTKHQSRMSIQNPKIALSPLLSSAFDCGRDAPLQDAQDLLCSLGLIDGEDDPALLHARIAG